MHATRTLYRPRNVGCFVARPSLSISNPPPTPPLSIQSQIDSTPCMQGQGYGNYPHDGYRRPRHSLRSWFRQVLESRAKYSHYSAVRCQGAGWPIETCLVCSHDVDFNMHRKNFPHAYEHISAAQSVVVSLLSDELLCLVVNVMYSPHGSPQKRWEAPGAIRQGLRGPWAFTISLRCSMMM